MRKSSHFRVVPFLVIILGDAVMMSLEIIQVYMS